MSNRCSPSPARAARTCAWSRLEAEAARERIDPAGALPDPLLRIELENITRNGTQEATLSPSRVGDTKYMLAQPLPFWGKRDLKREIASRRGRAGRAAAPADTWAEVAGRIKSALRAILADPAGRCN